MKKYLTLSLLLLSLLSMAQKAPSPVDMWNDIREQSILVSQQQRRIIPEKYRTLSLDLEQMKTILSSAPLQFSEEAQHRQVILQIPMPNGGFQSFSIVDAPIMHPKMAKKYPYIHTYAGHGIDDPSAYLRLDVTQFGFHAMILSDVNGDVFIDPYAHLDTEHYISYYRKDYRKSTPFICEFDEKLNTAEGYQPSQTPKAGDCLQRQYTLALACTGEYAAFFGGTVAGAFAGMTTSMNRVNAVYEKEVSITMQFVANEDTLIFTNSATDPYTNGSGSTMLGQNQTTCNARIGINNYDIGHVFSTGGGGIASLGCVCTTVRAQGVTGSGSPTGDAYDIDYVAHEMGHQFGANHTFNSSVGSCSGNQNNSTAYETGSGTTIMAYAGICGSTDVQPHSDAYFHGASLTEIGNFVSGTTGNSCATTTNTANNAPTANAGADYTIPKSTYFVLTGTSTDPDANDVRTYCWEQMDNTTATQPPPSTNTTGPMFRSLSPTTSPSRYFPKLDSIVNNISPKWEVLPSVGRTLNFRLNVRDNATGGGCTAEDAMVVTVNGTAGPFVVTAPNTAVTWGAGTQQTVTWNVASTDVAPVSCANVAILLSVDGGYTYPYTLIASTPNDGTQAITMPSGITSTTARVMVKSVGNIFFDISNVNFIINNPNPDFTLALSPDAASICAGASPTSNVTVGVVTGFTGNVALTSSGAPAGATVSFNPATVAAPGTSTMTVTTTPNVASGAYAVTVTGTSGNLTHTAVYTLTVSNGVPGSVTLVSPANAATNVGVQPTFTWNAASGAASYGIRVATDAAFNNTVISVDNINGTSYTPAITLNTSTNYYWEVRGVNICGNGNFSNVFVFTTANIACVTTAATDVPQTISSSGIDTVISIINVPVAGTITDVNVLSVNITHTYIDDISARLISPTGTVVILVNRPCNSEDNMDISFDSESANTNASIPCPPVGGGTYQPLQSLTAFNGQQAFGNWKLMVIDHADQDGGSLNGWSLNFCRQLPPPVTVTATSAPATCNGSATGSVTATGGGGLPGYMYNLNGGAYQTSNVFSGLAAGTYTVGVKDTTNTTATTSVTVAQPTVIALSTISNNSSGATGSITLTVSGGTAPYTYHWSNNINTQNISSLATGTYTVTVTDSHGCTKTTSAIVYCNTGGLSTANEWINYVKIGTIIKTSGNNNGYANYTSLSTDAVLGSTVACLFRPGYSGASLSENWRVYVDFNHDGDFGDAGERVVTKVRTGNFAISFVVPATALTGPTRIRVMMRNGAFAPLCGTYAAGETEEYTLNILPVLGLSEGENNELSVNENVTTGAFPDDASVKVYPNPARNTVNLSLQSVEQTTCTVTMTNQLGGVILQRVIDVQEGENIIPFETSNLPAGIYFMTIAGRNKAVVSRRIVLLGE